MITEMENEIGPPNANVIKNTILSAIGVGPITHVFGPGLCPSLNDRSAIYVSHPAAANTVLTLRSKEQPSVLHGLGHNPADFSEHISSSSPLLPATRRPS